MMSETSVLTADELAQLAVLADIILPRHGDMPSASAVGVIAGMEKTTFASRPDLVSAVRKALCLCAERNGADAVRYLAKDHPTVFSSLLQTLAGTYYTHPEIRRLLGYPGQLRR